MFFKGSRYERVRVATGVDASGRPVTYKTMRVIADAPLEGDHVVRQGVRIDQIAAVRLGQSEDFWRICDANLATWPPDLVAEVGRRLVIPSSDD